MARVQISWEQSIAIEIATSEQQQQVAKLVMEQLVKDIHIYNVPYPPNNTTNIRQSRAFLSAEQHLNMTPEDLSERWVISVAQAALTLKATTHKLVRSEIMPLSCRYQADRIFNVKRLKCKITTDTMHAKVNSIHGGY